MAEFKLIGFELNSTSALLLSTLVIFSLLSFLRLVYAKSIPEEYLPESTMLILFGLLIGTIIAVIPTEGAAELEEIMSFDTSLFLFIFVPVIIFDASYFLNKEVFFRNFLEIFVYAVIGTIINTIVIGGLLLLTEPALGMSPEIGFAPMFTFASLCSAVDPVSVMAIFEKMHVNANLYNLAFGESTLNDGVSIVLFELFRGIASLQEENKSAGEIVGLGIAKFFISVFGGIIVALVISFFFTYITKFTSSKLPNLETLLFIMAGFLSYLLADSLMFSGIMGVMTCGLFLSRYASENISMNSRNTFKTVIHMLAQTFETFLFLDIGFEIAFISVADEQINFKFIGCLICYTFIARIFGVYFLTFFLNIRRKKQGVMINLKEQFILTWGGLRGAIAFALAPSIESGNDVSDELLLYSTCCLIIFTIIVYGLTMKPLLECMKVKKDAPERELADLNQQETEEKITELVTQKPIPMIIDCVNVISGNRHSHNFTVLCKKIDFWLQKVLLKQVIPKEPELLEALDHLTEKEIQGTVQVENEQLNKYYTMLIRQRSLM